MKPEKFETITPVPFFKIVFSCSNRSFYDVKSKLYEIAEGIGLELQDGYITEKCDYEGDLEEIVIYTGSARGNDKFRKAVLEYYEVDVEVPDDQCIHLAMR